MAPNFMYTVRTFLLPFSVMMCITGYMYLVAHDSTNQMNTPTSTLPEPPAELATDTSREHVNKGDLDKNVKWASDKNLKQVKPSENFNWGQSSEDIVNDVNIKPTKSFEDKKQLKSTKNVKRHEPADASTGKTAGNVKPGKSSENVKPKAAENMKEGNMIPKDKKPWNSEEKKHQKTDGNTNKNTKQLKPEDCANSVRVNLVEQYCTEHSPNADQTDSEIIEKMEHVLVDEVNKVLYCVPYKAASTTWLMIVHINTGAPEMKVADLHKGMPANVTKPLNTYPLAQARQMLKTYYKFTAVRHPFDRLQSFYVNKFLDGQWNATQALMWLLPKSERHNVAEHVRRLSFSTVMQYTMDYPWPLPHTAGPYMEMCHPCFVHYDYIAKVETHDEDAKYIVTKHLKGKGLDIHKNRSTAPQKDKTMKKQFPYFRNLTEVQLDRLITKHKADFEMFGYTFNRDTVSGGCKMKENGCC